MIRKSTNNDLEKIMQIWLDTNISVHNYIPQEYWTSNEKYVKEAIQEAEVYVYEENKEIKELYAYFDFPVLGNICRREI